MGMLCKMEEVLKKNFLTFYDKLKCELYMHFAGDLVICLGDIDRYVGWHVDGFDGVHGGYGIAQRKLEGIMILEFCLEKEL